MMLPDPRHFALPGVDLHCDLPMRTRDGTVLLSDVFLPRSGEPAPALLLRTPYGKEDALTQGYLHPLWYAEQGYAVVCQDVRGTGASQGDFIPYVHEAGDGADAVAWTAEQSWCNGRVGAYGFSYSGATQLLMAPHSGDALRAFAPGMTGSNYCEGWTYSGGALNLAFILGWVCDFGRNQALRAGDVEAGEAFVELMTDSCGLYERLPLSEAIPTPLRRFLPYLSEWLDHPTYDDYWLQWSPRENYAQMPQPGLHTAGWYDIFVDGTIENHAALSQQGAAPQQLLIGPWLHMPWGAMVGAVDFGVSGEVVDEAQIRFFDRWLKGQQPSPPAEESAPPVRYFLMGRNLWQSAEAWPPKGTRERVLHLASAGLPNRRPGKLEAEMPTEQSPDALPVNPFFPVPSAGGRGCCVENRAPMGPADQRPLAARNDVLLFDTPPLPEDLVCAGAPVVELHLASTGVSGDVVVQLVDLAPDGVAINVCDGIRRVAHNGEVQCVALRLSNTAMAFRKGHRIRLQIAGSSFPLYSRNPQSGVDPLRADRSQFKCATQFVFHDARYPSRLILPVLTEDV